MSKFENARKPTPWWSVSLISLIILSSLLSVLIFLLPKMFLNRESGELYVKSILPLIQSGDVTQLTNEISSTQAIPETVNSMRECFGLVPTDYQIRYLDTEVGGIMIFSIADITGKTLLVIGVTRHLVIGDYKIMYVSRTE